MLPLVGAELRLVGRVLVEQDLVEPAVIDRKADVVTRQRVDPLYGFFHAESRFLCFKQGPNTQETDLLKDRGFAVEVLIERSGAHSEPGGDVAHGDARLALLTAELDAHSNDLIMETRFCRKPHADNLPPIASTQHCGDHERKDPNVVVGLSIQTIRTVFRTAIEMDGPHRRLQRHEKRSEKEQLAIIVETGAEAFLDRIGPLLGREMAFWTKFTTDAGAKLQAR